MPRLGRRHLTCTGFRTRRSGATTESGTEDWQKTELAQALGAGRIALEALVGGETGGRNRNCDVAPCHPDMGVVGHSADDVAISVFVLSVSAVIQDTKSRTSDLSMAAPLAVTS